MRLKYTKKAYVAPELRRKSLKEQIWQLSLKGVLPAFAFSLVIMVLRLPRMNHNKVGEAIATGINLLSLIIYTAMHSINVVRSIRNVQGMELNNRANSSNGDRVRCFRRHIFTRTNAPSATTTQAPAPVTTTATLTTTSLTTVASTIISPVTPSQLHDNTSHCYNSTTTTITPTETPTTMTVTAMISATPTTLSAPTMSQDASPMNTTTANPTESVLTITTASLMSVASTTWTTGFTIKTTTSSEMEDTTSRLPDHDQNFQGTEDENILEAVDGRGGDEQNLGDGEIQEVDDEGGQETRDGGEVDRHETAVREDQDQIRALNGTNEQANSEQNGCPSSASQRVNVPVSTAATFTTTSLTTVASTMMAPVISSQLHVNNFYCYNSNTTAVIPTEIPTTMTVVAMISAATPTTLSAPTMSQEASLMNTTTANPTESVLTITTASLTTVALTTLTTGFTIKTTTSSEMEDTTSRLPDHDQNFQGTEDENILEAVDGRGGDEQNLGDGEIQEVDDEGGQETRDGGEVDRHITAVREDQDQIRDLNGTNVQANSDQNGGPSSASQGRNVGTIWRPTGH